jgi:uncharacterized protein YyaL (SSP411 family)
MSQDHANRLINESSPYLLQHAHNPVNWFPWGEEALQKASSEDKPILVSIGYAACHWCHVMERESFEDESTAALMNERFVCIKIDREERPDLDHIYMDAVQSMTGSGGWPLNVFLTPDGKPFYGGTYFPPRRAFNRPSWSEILHAVSNAFHEKRDEIDRQANDLTGHLAQANSFGLAQPRDGDENLYSKEKLHEAFMNIMQTADRQWGGFGNAPKFPQTFSIQFLLRYHFLTGNADALDQACLSLDKMISGGIYDQLGGGFARYSTDAEWLAPHFEKMLYDNALLISVLSEAYQLTNKLRYKEVIDETIGFLQRELMHSNPGFFAALDADSEGEEGKFYVWKKEEIEKILGDDAGIFCDYFDVSDQGNWEGRNILRVKKPLDLFSKEHGLEEKNCRQIIERGKKKLLAERNKRERPMLDDKILLGWNALMNIACSKAFSATGNAEYKELAIENMKFLLKNFNEKDAQFFHTWKNDKAKFPAFLDDLAFLIQALIRLQEITGNSDWLIRAKEICSHIIDQFSTEEDDGFFFFTGRTQTDVIIRKKEVYDGAVPSGNSMMALNLYELSILFDRPDWRQRSEKMVTGLGNLVTKYPGSFGIWISLLQQIIDGTQEIAVIGKNAEPLSGEILSKYLPHKLLMQSKEADERFPILAQKTAGAQTKIYLCQNYTCHQPFSSVGELVKSLNAREQ